MDIALTRGRLVVLVHGCFWHSCPNHGIAANCNAAFRRAKPTANRTRDRDARLHAAGYEVLGV